MLVAGAMADFVLFHRLTGRARSLRARAAWMHKWAPRYARQLFGTRVELRGRPPAAGFVACNHLSYLDIFVLGSVQPMVFVAKADVRGWPVFGWLTRMAGTIFLKRAQRADVARASEEFAPAMAEQLVVTMFLEGTSSDGSRVLPFRPSLLEPAAAHGWPVTPVWIGYSLREGSVAREVCYWGDMTLGPHLLNLLTKGEVTAHVAFGEPLPPGLDRKEMARRLHAQVCELAARFGRNVAPGTAEDFAAIARIGD